MKATKVCYSRLVSKPNFENVKIGIDIEVGEGESAAAAYTLAKDWVDRRAEIEKMSDYTVLAARKVMLDKRNHTLAQIEEAEEILSKVEIQDDLPF